jgi:hypothetical protein
MGSALVGQDGFESRPSGYMVIFLYAGTIPYHHDNRHPFSIL